ncbi:hypothetical protein FALBO_13082 [Fusarium albosuccineum]|uniref:Uncharacterized protein n=1 Tax=Fusarium albosuccineum TaxID=1237068 RepID=A0A8H4KZG8_9HYPO|nr:hypothetical protein FALBO_13082 [Fusarium albosuccineum]
MRTSFPSLFLSAFTALPLSFQDTGSQLCRNNIANNAQQQQQGGPHIILPPVWPEGSRLLWVDVSGQQLAPYTKNARQRAALALPGRAVIFLGNPIRLQQVTGMRDSYVNAFIIQSRGARVENPCSSCFQKQARDTDLYAAPFPHCIRLPGHFGGCCGNCKWPDRAASCSKRDEVVNVWAPVPDRVRAPDVPLALLAAGSRAEDPILLDEEDPVVISDDDPEFFIEEEDGADPVQDEETDIENEMDLVPIRDDGPAGAGSAEDPLRLD